MAKKVETCFFCHGEVDLNGHHFTMPGPNGQTIYCHEYPGVRENGGIEVNAPEPEPETEAKEEENGNEGN